MPVASPELQTYFKQIEKQVKEAYLIAEKAREKYLDPTKEVEIALAKELPEKIEMLISDFKPELKGSGLSSFIRKLEKKFGKGNKEKVAFGIIKGLVKERFCKFKNKKEKAEIALRAAEAYYTLGLTVAHSEGITNIKVKRNPDNEKYLSIYYASPIRAAGGTAAAISVLFLDYIRKLLNFSRYKPTRKEALRYHTEIIDYFERVQAKQYRPTKEEVVFLINHLPVEINGMPTEQFEVSKYKDLERVETNRVRGGVVLVMTDAIPLKASKMLAKIKELLKDKEFAFLEDWLWLEDYIDLQQRTHTGAKEKKEKTESKEKEKEKMIPNFKYLDELVAGRPIFSYPLSKGGFRVRYGRTRLTGSESVAINPATMKILDNFLATGTQIAVERPGKAKTVTPCEVIKGPIVKLKDGSVVEVNTSGKARSIKNKIKEIIFLGDILISYGDFVEHNHLLFPSAWCEEWWVKLFKKAIQKKFGKVDYKKASEVLKIPANKIKSYLEEYYAKKPPITEAIKISENLQIPFHPSYTFFWESISPEEVEKLINWLKEAKLKKKRTIKEATLPLKRESKRILEVLGVPHKLEDQKVILRKEEATAVYYTLGLLDNLETSNTKNKGDNGNKETMEMINSLSPIEIRPKAPVYLGARMGRPEKGKPREMKGKPQVLFPVGRQGGRRRSLNKALSKGKVVAEFPIYQCPSCGQVTMYKKCEKCGKKTFKKRRCRKCKKYTTTRKHCGLPTLPYEKREIDIRHYTETAKDMLEIKRLPPLVKGVRGTTNKERVPEHLAKGILRAKRNLHVFKDGTLRFDMTEEPLTHFKPEEINTSVETLKELGYTKDINGNPLEDESQILELKPQDLILPVCSDKKKFFDEPDSYEFFKAVADFIDELLTRFYNLDPYYKIKKKSDVVGQLVIILAPHTSSGTVGRIIGFSETQVCFAHPYMHSASRRDCDGDEFSFMLLMDGLINFSRQLLPDRLGTRSMDAPLVLTSCLDPTEIDSEVYDLDTVWEYPFELYEKSLQYTHPLEVKIERVEDRLDKPEQYEGLGYTHPVDNLNEGVRVSNYKTLTEMMGKIKKQLQLAEKINAVDASEVARLTIEKHFLRDIKGNLRKFSQQVFRCIDCNKKFRRAPLNGKCSRCNGKLVLTIPEGSVEKYLQPSKLLAEKYDVPSYLKQTLEILGRRINSLFGKKSNQTTLVSHLS